MIHVQQETVAGSPGEFPPDVRLMLAAAVFLHTPASLSLRHRQPRHVREAAEEGPRQISPGHCVTESPDGTEHETLLPFGDPRTS